jgi:hypothetical protein
MTATPERAEFLGRLEAIAAELAEVFRGWRGETWSDARFNEWACRIFALQFELSDPLRKYWISRGADPGRVRDWRDIPPIPTAAFRQVEFRAVQSIDELRFQTSGTTRGRDSRGRHIVPFPELYRASLRGPFRHYVLGERHGDPLILSLVPTFATTRDSSLAWMLDDLIAGLGRPGSRSVAHETGVNWQDLEAACRTAELEQIPVCLAGTTLACSAWSDRLQSSGTRFSLPPGSILMDTGGAKGGSDLERGDMLSRLLPRLGLRPAQAVNEFGMTELLSQMYGHGTENPPLKGPPWLRTLVVDPVSLEPRPDGSEGILCHFDLANAGSVIGVLTEDRGRIDSAGLTWLGRSRGAPPRGCSLATAELLAVQEDV